MHYTGVAGRYRSDITQAAPDRIAGFYTTQRGDRVTFVRDGRSLYMRSTPSFWATVTKHGGSAFAHLADGKWLLLPKRLGRLAVRPTPAHRLFDEILRIAGTFENAGDTTRNGQTLITLKAGSATLYLRSTHRDYPVAYLDDPNGERFTFDHWNAPLRVSAPRHAIDLAKLPNFPKPGR